MKLILASASPRRAQILRDAAIPFIVLSSAVDETPVPGEAPYDYVQRLADAKAELAAARAVGPSIVIAADTVVTVDDHIIGKPCSREDARRVLEKLSGRTHSVITGVTVIRLPDAERRGVAGKHARGLFDVLCLVAIHDGALVVLDAPGPLANLERYRIPAQFGNRDLHRGTCPQ